MTYKYYRRYHSSGTTHPEEKDMAVATLEVTKGTVQRIVNAAYPRTGISMSAIRAGKKLRSIKATYWAEEVKDAD